MASCADRSGLGTARVARDSPAPSDFQPVPVSIRASCAIDLVLVSHDHYDHLDYPTIRELAKRDVPVRDARGRPFGPGACV
jgi:L-ascorbate metabolism protein UlaG (beta-lactamase superfamily)